MKSLAILFLALGLVRCAHPTAQEAVQPLLEDPLLPATLGYRLSMSQVVASQYGGEMRSLRVAVEMSPERLVMVGVSHVGVLLFTLERSEEHTSELQSLMVRKYAVLSLKK